MHPDFTEGSSALHAPGAPWAPMRKQAMAVGLIVFGAAICAAGITIGDTDDAPGAAFLGILLMIGAVALAVKVARRKA